MRIDVGYIFQVLYKGNTGLGSYGMFQITGIHRGMCSYVYNEDIHSGGTCCRDIGSLLSYLKNGNIIPIDYT